MKTNLTLYFILSLLLTSAFIPADFTFYRVYLT